MYIKKVVESFCFMLNIAIIFIASLLKSDFILFYVFYALYFLEYDHTSHPSIKSYASLVC